MIGAFLLMEFYSTYHMMMTYVKYKPSNSLHEQHHALHALAHGQTQYIHIRTHIHIHLFAPC